MKIHPPEVPPHGGSDYARHEVSKAVRKAVGDDFCC
jgi:hypothetical protein